MTSTSPLAYALCLVAIAMEAILSVLILKNGRQWQSLRVYVMARCAWNATLMPLLATGAFASYFYFYWAGRGILVFVELWLLVEFFSAITAGLRLFPALTRRALAITVVGLCFLGMAVAASQPINHTLWITRVVLYCDRGVSVVEACLLLSIFAAAALAPGHVQTATKRIGAGISISIASRLVIFCLLPYLGQRHASALSNAAEALDILVLSIWLVAFRKPLPSTVSIPATPQILSNLRQRAAELQANSIATRGQ